MICGGIKYIVPYVGNGKKLVSVTDDYFFQNLMVWEEWNIDREVNPGKASLGKRYFNWDKREPALWLLWNEGFIIVGTVVGHIQETQYIQPPRGGREKSSCRGWWDTAASVQFVPLWACSHACGGGPWVDVGQQDLPLERQAGHKTEEHGVKQRCSRYLCAYPSAYLTMMIFQECWLLLHFLLSKSCASSYFGQLSPRTMQ